MPIITSPPLSGHPNQIKMTQPRSAVPRSSHSSNVSAFIVRAQPSCLGTLGPMTGSMCGERGILHDGFTPFASILDEARRSPAGLFPVRVPGKALTLLASS